MQIGRHRPFQYLRHTASDRVRSSRLFQDFRYGGIHRNGGTVQPGDRSVFKMISSGPHADLLLPFRQFQDRRSVGRNFHIHRDFPVPAGNSACHRPVHGFIAGLHLRQAAGQRRADQNLLISRSDQIDACHFPVQPVADGPVGIVIQRIHAGSVKTAVRQDGIPSLPDRCRPPRGCFAYSTVISVISSLLLSICLNPSSIFRIFILSDHAFSL